VRIESNLDLLGRKQDTLRMSGLLERLLANIFNRLELLGEKDGWTGNPRK
jgi:hypothetical protein